MFSYIFILNVFDIIKKECFIYPWNHCLGVNERYRPNHEWPGRNNNVTWFWLQGGLKIASGEELRRAGHRTRANRCWLHPPPPGLEGTAGPPVSRSDKCSRGIGKQGGLGGTSWRDAATRVGGAIFPLAPSRTLARFFIIFPPSSPFAFPRRGAISRRASPWRRGKILVLSAKRLLGGGKRRLAQLIVFDETR